jgi:O-antigen/teichoic acid export membrane protein
MLLLPPAALVVGSAPELLRLAYGAPFAPAAAVLGPLVLGGWALVFVSVTTAILTAGGLPNLTLALTGPLVPLAFVGAWLVVPRGGLLGAALVTGLLAVVCAGVSLWAVARHWGVWPPAATVVRCLALAVVAYALGALWPTPGLWLLLKLMVGTGLLGLGLAALGEVAPAEARWLWDWLRSLRRWPAAVPARSDV